MNKSSFFTTIEDEATLSGLRIQSIFKDVATQIAAIFSKTSTVQFSDAFNQSLLNDYSALRNYIQAVNDGLSADEAFAATMREASTEAQNFANSINAVGLSNLQAANRIKEFVVQQKMAQVSRQAENRNLGNIRTLLNEYNSSLQNNNRICASTGLTQRQFTDSINQSNSSLGKYLVGLNGGKATMLGYTINLVGAKLATIGLRFATMALNAVIGMGIGLIVSLISSGIMELIEFVKENTKPVAERLSDINSELKETESTIKEISNGYQQLKKDADEVIPRFAELAKGVNSFGENVSLTDEEYAEFLELNNKIAEMFPELNLGMNDSGNAMLNLSYSADTLTQSLEALVEAQRKQAQQDLAKKLPDLVDNTKKKRAALQEEIDNYKKDITNYNDWIEKFANGSYTTGWAWSEWDGITKTAEQKILDSAGVKYHREIAESRHVDGGGINYNAAHDEVKYKYVIDEDVASFERAMNDYIAGINSQIHNAETQIENTWKEMSPSLNAWLQTNDTYGAFGEGLQKIATSMLNNIDWEKTGKESKEEITGYIENEILEPLSQTDFKTQDAFNKLIEISPDKFDSLSAYTNAIRSSITEIAEIANSDKLNYNTIFAGLGYDEILKKYQDAVDSIRDIIPNVSEEMIKSLSPSEVIEAFNVVKENGITDWNDLLTFIESKRFSDSFHIEDIDKLNDELKDLKSTFDSVSDIIDDYNEKRYYSLDNLKSLMDLEPEYLNALIDENGQINLNTQAYKDYVAAKAKTLVVDQIKSLYEHLLEMSAEEAQAYANATAYNAETRSLEDLIGATTQYYLVLARAKDAKNNTTAYTDALRKSFGTVANYAAVYDSWLKSLSTSTNEFTDKTDKSTDSLKQQKTALENQKKALENSKKSLENYKKGLDDAQDSLKDLIDLTIDYIKQIKENEKDALNKQKENFDELISKRKEALELAKKEREEADKLAEKQNSVVKAKLAFSIAQLDDSSAGKKAQKKAADNLKTANKDLSDYLNDREYNARVESLDKEKEAFDQNIDEQTKKIDEYLQNARQLYEDACNMIDNDTGDLYGKLWNDYVYPYTTKTRAEFDYLWNSAQIAIQKYQGDNETLIGVMNRLQGEIYATDTQINALDGEIDNLGEAIDSTNSALDSTSGVIDNVAVSLDGLGSSISDYIDQLNRLANTTVGDNTNKTSFWVNYNGKKYETGSHYNGDTKENRLLAANELTKLIAKDVSGFDNYGLSQIQALLGVGTNSKVHGWYYQFDGKTYTSTSQSKDNAVKQIRQQLASKYGNSSFVLDQVYGKIQKYAEGTRAAHGGLSIVDEEGLFSEFIPYQVGKGRYSFLPEGNPVFSKAMTNTMFDFASDPTKFVNSIINNSTRKSGDTTFSSAPVYHIYGNIDDSTLQRMDKQEKKRYELFKKQFMLEMLRENKNL